MECYSTNNLLYKESIRKAILQGLAPDKGLFMPSSLPQLPQSFFDRLPSLSLPEIAYEVSANFFKDEIAADDLKALVNDAFDFEIPLRQLDEDIHVLELFHGPTLAFKDVGARFMSRVMARFNKQELIVLAATSGDTGSAVASGFYDVPGIQVVILYPSGKVSEIQEKQLTTYGKNIHALEVQGAFDDCQAMVKKAFNDESLQKLNLTTANSINLARLIPQSFYYFYAMAQLGAPKQGAQFSVPSGNFGNITAGMFAKRMGLPVTRFIAATNVNDIVPAYLQSGLYKARPSVKTISNAMDVGDPSNFARILALYEQQHMNICGEVEGYSFTDAETVEAMQTLHRDYQYVADPHSAIAYAGLKKYQQDSPGTGVFLATAHPAKFLDVVEEAIGEPVAIPEKLEEVMKKPKKAELVPNDYQKLRDFVLEL
jgi:threonine synthase